MHRKYVNNLWVLAGIFSILFWSDNTFTESSHSKKTAMAYLKPAKKKILVFTSTGGGGHISASNAIKDYLKNEYEITVTPILEVLESFDTIKTLTFNRYSGEQLYNYLITNNWVWLTNKIFFNFGSWLLSWQNDSMAKALEKYFKYNYYDLVISVVPVFNGSLLKALKAHNLPLLVIPTDLDATLFVQGLDKPTYKKFNYFLEFDDADMRKKIESAKIPEDRTTINSGFPIRPNFFQKKDKHQIKKDFNVPDKKKVVMVLMGAAGSQASFKYVRRISKGKVPLHILACIGRNEDARKKISEIPLPEHITLTIVGFTDRIADLMYISDILITKTGSVSFCEGLYMNVPMILDNTMGGIAWESFNVAFLKKHNLGEVVTSYRQLNPIIEKFLEDPNYYNTIKSNLLSLKKGNFQENLTRVVKHLLSEDLAI